MKEYKKVQGSEAQAEGLIVNKDTVYVHTNIIKVEKDTEGNPVEGLYEYDEIQYTKDEYIELLSKKNEELQSQIIDISMALCDVYEAQSGGNV